MAEEKVVIEIFVTDFVEDPVDDSAFGINFQINGPGDKVEFLRVSFSDEFFEDYFRISFPKELGEEVHRLQKEKRELFIRWAICRIEKWLAQKRPEPNLLIDSGEGCEWAKKVEMDKIKPLSSQKTESEFVCEM